MKKLETNYLGLKLKNPLVVSASPFSEKVEAVVELEKAGVSALVMHSLFEEQITHESLSLDHHLEYGTDSFAEALSYFPDSGRYTLSTDSYLEKLRDLKKAVDIPIIASLNGSSSGKWIEFAEKIEAMGADALELNLYYLPTDPEQTSMTLENTYLELVQNICRAVEIPVAAKLSPFFSSLPNFSKNLADAGVQGLVLFNRFYQPDLDLDELEVVPKLNLSNNQEMLLPLRWVSILYGRVDLDFALTSGVQSGLDVLKAMMAGANVTMVASELLRKGYGRATEILESINMWMEENDYESIQQMQGSMSMQSVSDPSAFERANYMKVLSSFTDLP
ncbi:MAG: dihydroorotate dehydrogenase-like protein [Chloroflexi bacterium]|jgi:dihydroorotate dehydrogenase (fumarate)|nr:dihydroorotate dehydrogenase-like protein [Chloroflexota bacterium]MBT4003651.1 dihydroorotate dehydrogenase-like protein [Chloroflexota bacterium]MBT4305829.1 dihydroorotate dehydrogenase-like protein [Chloroflexota bacterium]MBT4533653.1 dihydroorotate dehydrogenase-like protein [Chloroflexota bacterium]MBT4681704.1 dihydroorotate dehydrogenase-like protein [Chloroflexota bacterium]